MDSTKVKSLPPTHGVFCLYLRDSAQRTLGLLESDGPIDRPSESLYSTCYCTRIKNFSITYLAMKGSFDGAFLVIPHSRSCLGEVGDGAVLTSAAIVRFSGMPVAFDDGTTSGPRPFALVSRVSSADPLRSLCWFIKWSFCTGGHHLLKI